MLLAEMTWPDVAALDRNTPVVFPLAALEQHGRHLPVFTDSMLMGEIARRASGSAIRTITSTSPARCRRNRAFTSISSPA
jgi:creatinine amidohydrolase